jgi:endoglucanase
MIYSRFKPKMAHTQTGIGQSSILPSNPLRRLLMITHSHFPRLLRLGTAAALLLGLASALLSFANRPPASAAAGDYSVSGNHILDPNGSIYQIHGVARSGYETSSSGDGHFTQTDMNNIHNWNANTVRIAFNESYLLSDSACYNAGYLTNLDNAVTAANNAGMNVIFDLHWNTANTTACATSQQNMADRRSLTAWNIMANRYKTNHKVFFELYNEPHDVSWAVWKNGDGTWAGMQEMYNTVRNAGYTNIVIMGGLNWAYDLSGVPSNRPTGYVIVFATHH